MQKIIEMKAKRILKISVLFCIVISIALTSILQMAFAAPPVTGNWYFYKGQSPSNFDNTLTFKVGSVDANGKLVNWKLGNNNLEGTYVSTTGKISFSPTGNIIGKPVYTGYHFKESNCSGGDIPSCENYMTGTWTSGIVNNKKSQGWIASINTFN